ncbi:uncharacterized protein LOC122505960 [Leptopilina heterotoma]|uniref:uncharacterized protein LOC122505960 n=1 Tax=Leptopilina heterotoma TaxID=63436 RepID=UPI001CAA1449|nr:uncharacterized protein LOC122505960 [Leptopilina heterotoma]
MDRFKSILAASIQQYSCFCDEFDEISFIDSSCPTDEKFYFANMCHACHSYGGENINLKRCSACGLVSYCCKEHQVKDWPSHKQFCKVICQIKKNWNCDDLFQFVKNTISRKSLHKMKNLKEKLKYYNSLSEFICKLLPTAVKLLQRKLNKAEYEMIQFPRICAVCYESKQELLTNCPNCPQSSFCKKHLNDPNHDYECRKTRTAFVTASAKRVDEVLSLLLKSGIIQSSYHPENSKLPSSMSHLLESRLSLGDSAKLKNFNITFTEEMKTIYNAALSEMFSRSCSILFAIDKLSLNLRSMVIHVVGATAVEQMLTDWEVICHYLPQLCQLEIILIGPDVMSNSRIIKPLCKQCMQEKKKLTIESRKVMYDKYCREDSYLKPDIIACFNPGLQVYDTWEKSINCFRKGKCPLLVTSQQKTEGIIEKAIITSSFPSAKCIFSDNNPFGSLAFQREGILLPVSSKNQFMSLYEFLEKKKVTK